jgi:hypothetical protein
MLTINAESHLDHGLSPAHVAWLLETFKDKDAFFIATVEIPTHLDSVECGLYGPAMGDSPVTEALVHYAVRPSRRCASRIVPLVPRSTRLLTVVAGPSGPIDCLLYTSYGGPAAPREPGDPSIACNDEEALVESRNFWADHALAAPPSFENLALTVHARPDHRFLSLVRSFPVLANYAPGLTEDRLDLSLLDAWAAHEPAAVKTIIAEGRGIYPGSGAVAAARFVLYVWDSNRKWKCGSFDLFQAFACWDREQRAAWRAWAADPLGPWRP